MFDDDMITKKIEIKISCGYAVYLKIIRHKSYFTDSRYTSQQTLIADDIAKLLKMSKKELLDIVKQNFHGYSHNNQRYPCFTFKDYKYAKEAKDWFESLFLMVKLGE